MTASGRSHQAAIEMHARAMHKAPEADDQAGCDPPVVAYDEVPPETERILFTGLNAAPRP